MRNSKEVLLINPPYTDYFSKEHFRPSRPSKETSTVSIPLGLAYIAGFLRENGVEVQCLDLELQPRSLTEIAKHVERKGVEVVGITATSPLIDKAIRIATYLKEKTRVKIVLGGTHGTAEPFETASLDCFDAVVVGEGEITIQEIVAGADFAGIKGLAFRDKKGRVVVNQRRPLIKDLDRLPFPALDLFPSELYRASLHRDLDPSLDQPYYTLISTRGCPYNCSFCYSKGVFLYRVRKRSINSVLDEIEGVCKKRGKVKIMFYDDTFTLNRKRITEFCQGVKDRRLQLVWGCNTRVDRVDRSMLVLMKKVGCKRVYVGVESGNDQILKRMCKRLTKDGIRQGIREIKESGLEISASYIIGAPGETRRTIQETIDLAIENNTDFAHFYAFTPDPGSPFYEELKQKGIIETFDWLDYDRMIRKGTQALGENIGWEEIISLTSEAYKRYYGRGGYREMRMSKLGSEAEEKQLKALIREYT